MEGVQADEGPREMTPGTYDRRSACPVVPVGSGVERSSSAEPDEQLLDQETIVEDEPSSGIYWSARSGSSISPTPSS